MDVAFAALLAVTRTATGVTASGLSAKTSPDQMFEPPIAEGRGGRAGAGQEARAGIDERIHLERYDRTSVTARRSAWAQQPIESAIERGAESTGTGTKQVDAMRSGQVAESTPAGRGLERLAMASGGSEAAPGSGDKPGPRSTLHGWSTPETIVPTVSDSAKTEMAAAASVRPGNAASNAQVETPAHRVAQLLGAARVSGVESARAPAAPSASTQSGTPQRAAAQRPATPPSAGQAAQQASSTRGTAVETTERTPFDELVRSIRLHTTPRSSSAHLQLDPPELGRVDVNVRVVSDRVELDVRTQTAAARRLVQERAGLLTAALERHGVVVERFEISTTSADESANHPAGDAGLDAPTDQTRHEPSETAPSSTNRVPVDEEDAVVMDDPGAITWAVSETRLDIRV